MAEGKETWSLLLDLKLAAIFLTRLPLTLPQDPPPGAVARATWCFPLIGFLIGALAAAVFLLAGALALSPWLAAVLALATGLLLTGCLHEDGLADMADGFGGGWTRERKLEIMRDSRLGTYGAAALITSLALRAGALASLPTPEAAALVLVMAQGLSRAPLSFFMQATPLARQDGQSGSAGRPRRQVALAALAVGLASLLVLLALLPWGLHDRLVLGLLVLSLLSLMFLVLRWLTKRQIGGYTGDVLGGLQQVNEIALLLLAAAYLA